MTTPKAVIAKPATLLLPLTEEAKFRLLKLAHFVGVARKHKAQMVARDFYDLETSLVDEADKYQGGLDFILEQMEKMPQEKYIMTKEIT